MSDIIHLVTRPLSYDTFKSTLSVFGDLEETTTWIFSSASVSLKMKRDEPLPSKKQKKQSAITSKLNILSCYYHNRFLPPGWVSIHNLIFYALPLSRCCQRSWQGGAESEEGGAQTIGRPRCGSIIHLRGSSCDVVDKWVGVSPGAKMFPGNIRRRAKKTGLGGWRGGVYVKYCMFLKRSDIRPLSRSLFFMTFQRGKLHISYTKNHIKCI